MTTDKEYSFKSKATVLIIIFYQKEGGVCSTKLLIYKVGQTHSADYFRACVNSRTY